MRLFPRQPAHLGLAAGHLRLQAVRLLPRQPLRGGPLPLQLRLLVGRGARLGSDPPTLPTGDPVGLAGGEGGGLEDTSPLVPIGVDQKSLATEKKMPETGLGSW